MALTLALTGEEKIIKRFIGNEDVIKRLRELGFVQGERVKVVGMNAGGMILVVRNVKIALDRALAARIIVE